MGDAVDCAQQDIAGLQLDAEDIFQLDPAESPAADEAKEAEVEDVLPEELAYHCNGLEEEETITPLNKALPYVNDEEREIEVSLREEVTEGKSN